MTTFQSVFQNFATIDAKIEEKKRELDALTEERKKLEGVLMKTILDRNLTANEFKIGGVKYAVSSRNVYSGLSLTYLNSKMREIIRDDDQVVEIMNKIRDDRTVRVVQELKKKTAAYLA
jgi:hypothetical protein